MELAADTFDGRDDRGRVLDRQIDLTRVSRYTLAWMVVLTLGALLRVVALHAWPLSIGEATIASDAYHLFRGDGGSMSARPLTTNLTTLAFFLFGVSDGVARLVPLIAGTLTLALIWPLGRRLGRAPALAAGVVAALSPTLAFVSERLGGGSLLTASSLLLILVVWRWRGYGGLGLAALTGVVAALLPLADPLGWLVLPLVLIVAWALERDDERLRPEELALAALGFAATVLLVSTSLLTHPGGLSTFFSQSFADLWNTRLLAAGSGWQLSLFLLLTEELPALILAVVAVVVTRRVNFRALRVVAAWTAVAVIAALILGGKDETLYSVAILPLALLAGYGLSWLLVRVPFGALRSYGAIGFLVALTAALAAALSAFGVLTGANATGGFADVLKFALLAVLIVAPLTLLAIQLGRALDAPAWPLVWLVGVVLLGALGLRSTTLLRETTAPRGGALLTASSTAQDIGSIVRQLQLVSRDLTDYDQSALDPTGGHGLSVTVESSVSQPFAWYFRDYPNFRVVPDGSAPGVPQPQVSITPGAPAGTPAPGIQSRAYAYRTSLAPVLTQPDWSGWARGLANPAEIRHFLGYLINRGVTTPSSPQQITMSLRSGVAQRLYGTPAGP